MPTDRVAIILFRRQLEAGEFSFDEALAAYRFRADDEQAAALCSDLAATARREGIEFALFPLSELTPTSIESLRSYLRRGED